MAQESPVLPDAKIDTDTVSLLDEGAVADEDIETLECGDSDGEGLITPLSSVLEGESIHKGGSRSPLHSCLSIRY